MDSPISQALQHAALQAGSCLPGPSPLEGLLWKEGEEEKRRLGSVGEGVVVENAETIFFRKGHVLIGEGVTQKWNGSRSDVAISRSFLKTSGRGKWSHCCTVKVGMSFVEGCGLKSLCDWWLATT